jgi:hypothetical protein
MNCWEFQKCGRDGTNSIINGLDDCPAYPNHGKECARVSGTYCKGVVKGSFARKLEDCSACDFYNSNDYNIKYKALDRIRSDLY